MDGWDMCVLYYVKMRKREVCSVLWVSVRTTRSRYVRHNKIAGVIREVKQWQERALPITDGSTTQVLGNVTNFMYYVWSNKELRYLGILLFRQLNVLSSQNVCLRVHRGGMACCRTIFYKSDRYIPLFFQLEKQCNNRRHWEKLPYHCHLEETTMWSSRTYLRWYYPLK